MTRKTDTATTDAPDLGRRRLLVKLGLAAGAAYAAPVLLNLSQARASSGASWSGPSGSGGRGRRRRRRIYGSS